LITGGVQDRKVRYPALEPKVLLAPFLQLGNAVLLLATMEDLTRRIEEKHEIGRRA